MRPAAFLFMVETIIVKNVSHARVFQGSKTAFYRPLQLLTSNFTKKGPKNRIGFHVKNVISIA